ncbi:putative ABC transporter ATP-binding protein [Planctomycetes bacterium Pan216]|uniref:Putative ABC transporter ATP-binding protein n=1 Tax=Kolteria novifilia TaxID=2527975 RepID=A0A518AZP1_9BACT|nr:putative ABC transporter ATP-binding protein [Planctomycetes bacterium Pan216]
MIHLRQVKKFHQRSLTPHAPMVAFRLDELDIDAGEAVALLGPNGSGKSTLLHLIAGMLRPEEGDVSVNGVRLDQTPSDRVDRLRGQTIGIIYPDRNLIPALTTLQNIRLGLRLGRGLPRIQRRIRAKEMLDRVSLAHRGKSYPSELTLIERQRVSLARAFAHDPLIILADEPTRYLEPASSRQLVHLLLALKEEFGATLLLATDDAELAALLPRRVDCAHLIQESDSPQ